MKFFKDGAGRVVIWQQPNMPLIGWLACKLLSMVMKAGHSKNALENLGAAFLFVWAYLEITDGKSYFRRALGVGVMVVLISGFFKHG